MLPEMSLAPLFFMSSDIVGMLWGRGAGVGREQGSGTGAAALLTLGQSPAPSDLQVGPWGPGEAVGLGAEPRANGAAQFWVQTELWAPQAGAKGRGCLPGARAGHQEPGDLRVAIPTGKVPCRRGCVGPGRHHSSL